MKVFWFFFGSLFFLTFLSYLFIDPNFFPLKNLYSGIAFQNRGLVSFFYILSVSSLFLSYLQVIRINVKKKLNSAQVVGLISVSSVILFFSYPAMLSYDIFNYLTTAKVFFHYFENPYLVMPIEFIGDPNLLFTHAANKFSLYGPSWVIITGIPYLLAFKNIMLSVVSFKILNLIFFWSTLYLLFKISKNIQTVLLFGLNPLVLIETLLGSHNDIVMMFFALMAVYLLTSGKKVISFISLVLSIFVKYATAFLFPVFAYYFFKKGKIKPEKIYFYSSCFMLLIFFLSFLREEIYPWYAIWFLVFVFLTKSKFLQGLSIVLSFFLMLRYVPYMYLGTHFGVTPFIKISLTFIPLAIFVVAFRFIKHRLNFQNSE